MVGIVQKYLRINNFAEQKYAFADLVQAHPDYPSFFAITDTLELLSIEHVAFKVLKEELFELPNSFLTLFDKDLALVTIKKNAIKIELEKTVARTLSFDDFLARWDGIVIAIEPNKTLIHRNLRTSLKWGYYSLPFLGLFLISIINNSYDISRIFLVLISIIGLIVSIVIVQEKLGIKNEMVSSFCDRSPKISCNSVINSDKGKINEWISFSDLPILFFAINLTSLLFNPTGTSDIISLVSLFSLPVIAYSIWIQKVQLKKWCLLCLAITFLIILQSAVSIFKKEVFIHITYSNLFSYLFSIILIASFWLVLRSTLVNKAKADKEVRNFKKIKRNYKVLEYLSKEVPILIGLDKLEGLRFGNPNAEVRLLIIVSPNCTHCHNAFTEALELVTKYSGKIFLNVLFNINPDSNDNPYKIVAERLLEINNSNETLAAEAITDWYVKKMGLEKWKKKWKVDFISKEVKQQIRQQYNWCSENKFNHTPVKIVNDKLFPNEYDIVELKYFFNDYAKQKQVFEKVI
jgi:uncharacterized membrane protein